MKTLLLTLALVLTLSTKAQTTSQDGPKPCMTCKTKPEPKPRLGLKFGKKLGENAKRQTKILASGIAMIFVGAIIGKTYQKAYEITSR